MTTNTSLIIEKTQIKLKSESANDFQILSKFKIKCIKTWKNAIKKKDKINENEENETREESLNLEILVKSILDEMNICCSEI
jgi:hypothetical protein